MARRHVMEAEGRVARLASRIFDMRAHGLDTALAERALRSFYYLLDLARDQLQREEDLAKRQRPK